MFKLKFRKCPLCNNDNIKLFYPETRKVSISSSTIKVTDKFFGLHGDIVKCSKCGFVYIGRKKYIDKIVNLYRDMQDEVYLNEEKERRDSFKRLIRTIEQIRLGHRGKMLDIGCCTGGLLVEANNMGWEVYGIDPSVWACKTAKKFHNLIITNTTIEKYNPEKKFDAITIVDVLEHVENPKVIINKIKSLISENGVICIVTPDFGSFTAKIFGKKWWGIRLAHLSYFIRKDLELLFSEAGLKVIKTKSFVRFFSLYYIFVRLFPFIESKTNMKKIMKRISIPLLLFDTFEIYLRMENEK